MRLTIAFCSLSLLLAACAKEAEDLAQDSGVLPSSCGSAGARLQATIGGASYCANGQVIATGDGASVVVTGVSLLGTTLIVQIDSVATGAFTVTEAANSLLYMENGTSYTLLPPDAGTITITHADTLARSLKADFSATLRNEMSGASRSVQGQLDVVWTDAE